MSYFKALQMDSLVYLISLLFILFIISKEKLSFKGRILLFIVFVVFSSPFNIMIKIIHDYNLVVPRTFIWFFKIKGLSPLDLFVVIYCLINFQTIYKGIKGDKLTKLIMGKELFVLILGLSSYFIQESYFLDSGRKLISTMRGPFYFVCFYSISRDYIKKPLKIFNYIKLLRIIFITSILSLSFYPVKEVWTRYGMRVTIIGQEMIATIFALLLTFLFFRSIKRKGKIEFLVVFTVINLNLYKIQVIYYLFIIILMFMITRNFLYKAFVLTMVLFTVLIFSINLGKILNLDALKTRSIQIEDYYSYIEDNNHAKLFGLGIKAPYYSETREEDGGEVKLIDKNTYGNYKFDIQTPILKDLKTIGFVGVIILIFFNLYIALLIFLRIKKIYIKNNSLENIEKLSLYTLLLFAIVLNRFMLIQSLLPLPLFYGFLLGRLKNRNAKVILKKRKVLNV